ncbi:27179_t:CDS:2 [Dentiscutata erythropus]|uniref:27179_t:CDS:1 n=1 Tax=Dentiscutata erythropus TaxID=1348616 RepID=A0A9N9IXZ3_9GLOM|nr:27179_t:CDS:2 [Dentiscutata erythropus]
MKLDQISSYCDKYPQEASNLSQVYLDLTTVKSWAEVKVKDIEPLQRCVLLGRTKVHDRINPPSDNSAIYDPLG